MVGETNVSALAGLSDRFQHILCSDPTTANEHSCLQPSGTGAHVLNRKSDVCIPDWL